MTPHLNIRCYQIDRGIQAKNLVESNKKHFNLLYKLTRGEKHYSLARKSKVAVGVARTVATHLQEDANRNEWNIPLNGKVDFGMSTTTHEAVI